MPGRGVPRRAFILLPLVVAGCATGREASENFPPLRYNYLPVLKLDVASIQIEDDWQPTPGTNEVSSLSPETPVAALRQMAEDRLGAYGTSGKAVFVIEAASIAENDSELVGSFAVRLDVYSANGTRSGFAEARVRQTAKAPSGEGEALRRALYDLTGSMMNTMNVQFEYQLRRSLGTWLVENSGAPAAIKAEPLGPPGTGGAAAPPPAPGAAVTPSPPATPQPGVLGTLPGAPTPAQASP